jgi:metal-dependent amidase/aminoacylase/carboxypeptidase family protein
VLSNLEVLLPFLESVYKDLHSHPELSMQATRTAAIAADRLRAANEYLGSFGAEWGGPSVFWFVGGIDADVYARAKKEGKLSEIPTHHNPRFAPVIHPTLATGVEAMAVEAEAWLSPHAH